MFSFIRLAIVIVLLQAMETLRQLLEEVGNDSGSLRYYVQSISVPLSHPS